MKTIRRVAVLGAGTMGSGIAALFAASNTPVLLLDVTAELAGKHAGALIETGSFETSLRMLSDVDWVLEAVVENRDAKRELWRAVAPHLRPDTIASTNTSGLSVAGIAEGLPDLFQRQFMGIHFFNPPGKLRLVEAIRTPHMDAELFLVATRFVAERLNKIVIEARDTPNFIANRIGAYFSVRAQSLALAGNWTVEEVDFLTGPLIGMPRSGTFRLMDVIGLDVWTHVLETSGFEVPSHLREMLRRGWLGVKSGGGFYKDQLALDLGTLEYRPRLPAPPLAEQPPSLRELLSRTDRNAQFLSPLLSGLIAYSHEVAPLIANAPGDLDLAMRFGYGWTLGPFEIEAALA